ncbi:MAG: hypothetical protein ACLSVD_19240 [Eggerthellaceae bacterium]
MQGGGMVEMALSELSAKNVVDLTTNARPPWCRTSWWCCAANPTRSLC